MIKDYILCPMGRDMKNIAFVNKAPSSRLSPSCTLTAGPCNSLCRVQPFTVIIWSTFISPVVVMLG